MKIHFLQMARKKTMTKHEISSKTSKKGIKRKKVEKSRKYSKKIEKN